MSAPSTDISQTEASIYDRQIRLWGVEAQKRIRGSNALLVGFRGINVEICKNLVLAGMSVTVLDSDTVQESDLGANFFLSKADVGKNRAEASLGKIKELNPHVQVSIITEPCTALDEQRLSSFSAICITGLVPFKEQIRIDVIASANNIALYCADAFGFNSYAFCNLGKHTYHSERTVQASDDTNEHGKRTITDDGKVKITETKEMQFGSLKDALLSPWAPLNKRKRTRVPDVYFALAVAYRNELDNENSSTTLKQSLDAILQEQKLDASFVEESELFSLLDRRIAQHELNPVCSVLSGILVQEIIKAVSRKDQPIDNFFFFDGMSSAGVIRKIPKPE